jgi:hypothetical protein
MSERLFISSVQKELAEERRAIGDFVRGDALLRRFFDVFLFEDLPASDRRSDDVYLDEVGRCALYVGLFGQAYGEEDAGGLSPTEREFDQATALAKPRLIFVKGADDAGRHPKMRALIKKAGAQLIRRRFTGIAELTGALYASLVEHLERTGRLRTKPFDAAACPDATLADLSDDKVKWFLGLARRERQYPLREDTPAAEVLAHLNLLDAGQPSHAAVGTRALGPQAPVEYELPREAVAEAIVNAVAHRDYASAGAVQVSVFADRVEVWNPGVLPPPLTPERLRVPHRSIARNARICEALFLARYIEKYGTGTLMMIRESVQHALPEPDFEQRAGEFVTTVWRDWLTESVLAAANLNERQRRAIGHIKAASRITSKEYQELTGATPRTTTRDLDALVGKGLLRKVGKTGRGAHYVVHGKPDKNRTNQPSGVASKGSSSVRSRRGRKQNKRT